MSNAETLFLVDNGKAQIFKVDVLGHQTVGAHHNINKAFFQPADNFLLLLRSAEAGEKFYFDREV